jgi:hypothetical protein
VNPGGEPERDDSALPPVDIEIPDDARELDRDVQAYYRELRAQRRQQRGRRVRGSLAKDSIVLPLLACCLILALITGTLLTVFTATSDQNLTDSPGGRQTTARPPAASSTAGGATSGRATSAAASSTAPASASTAPASSHPGVLPGVLPPATITVYGEPTRVHDLRQAALVLIPPNCHCTATVSWLINVVADAHARTYLVYTTSTMAEVDRVYWSLSSSDRMRAVLAAESDDQLADSVTASLHAEGLTAILIGRTKVFDVAGLQSHDYSTALMQDLGR